MAGEVQFLSGPALKTDSLQGWNGIVESAFHGSRIDAEEARFDAVLDRLQIANLGIIGIQAQTSRVRRWVDAHPSRRSGVALLHLQAQGISVNSQCGRMARLQPGEGVLCDPDIAYAVDFETDYDMFVLEVPTVAITSRCKSFEIEDIGCQLLHPARAKLLLSFVSTIWSQRDCLAGDIDWRESVSRVGLDLALAAISGSVPDRLPGPTSALSRRVFEMIDANFTDPDLKTSTIARTLGVSPRSVQSVFERVATTTSAYVLARRLRHAANMLRSDHAPGSITDIAYLSGFSDSAYFSRCFRREFGVSPREFRQLK